MELMLNLAAPQPGYAQVIEAGGILQPMDGLTVTFSRALTEHVLRHHELFSSVGGIDLGNIRPLIPLNVDPPQHSKYRKILDPLFAPRRMDAQEADITARVNHFIDAFVDRGECNFSEEFAELLPSSVFLGLMGLPWDELDTFLHLRDGILRPDKIDPDAMFVADAAHCRAARDRPRDLRVLRRGVRRAGAAIRPTTSSRTSSRSTSTASGCRARRSSTSASSSSSPGSTR